MKPIRVALVFLSLIMLALVSAPARSAGPDADRLTPKEVADSVLSTMDKTADPCQDFYRYACGGWLDKTQLPPDRPRWGRGFTEIAERNLAVEKDILEKAVSDPGKDADLAKLGTFYGACMDEGAAEKAGATPLAPMLEEIKGVKDVAGLMTMAGKLHRIGARPLFRLGVEADFKDPDTDIAQIYQGGMGMPDRDYYLKDDDRHKSLRTEYQAHVGRMLALLGESKEDADRHAADILKFETALAEAAWPRAELRDPDKTYHKLDIDGLKKLTPELSWSSFFTATGYPNVKDINVAVPDFMKGMAAAAAKASPETMQAYLRFHYVSSVAPTLSKAFVDENFAIMSKFSGQKEIQPRWKRCIGATDDALGMSLGKYYVERKFAGDSKEKALEMIHGIEAAFQANLPNLHWMDNVTRGRAVQKMKAIINKIGYPDKWRDYSKLAVKKGDYFGNTMAANVFEFNRQAEKVGKPVDKTEWGMTPPTVNAYYNPLVNEIVFPAGILQRPYFNRDFPPAMNLGGMGMVVGHELTHGFDDEGRKFDATGRLREWWEPKVVEAFETRAQCVEKLYDGYEVQPGVHLNGKLTLGENIADLGGLKEAYGAYQLWIKEHGATEPIVEGLTNDQLFFLGFAQTWCTVATPEFERLMATVDPHSAPRYRVIGPISQFPEFGEAFSCKEGTPMRPKDTCEVW